VATWSSATDRILSSMGFMRYADGDLLIDALAHSPTASEARAGARRPCAITTLSTTPLTIASIV
jgi:hypothetical protein